MITKEAVEKAQNIWAAGIINIGQNMHNPANLDAAAEDLLNTCYAFDGASEVIFKPTKAAAAPFRLRRRCAKSYFVGGDALFPEDKGFALQPWVKIVFENAGMILEEHRAIAMGNYFFTSAQGAVVKVEYTFSYKSFPNGQLKVDLHHSSLPYNPDMVAA